MQTNAPPTDLSGATPLQLNPGRKQKRLHKIGFILLALWLFAGGLFLFVREIVVPNIKNYRDEIAAVASDALGAPVSIDELQGTWTGFRLQLNIKGLNIQDQTGHTAFSLDRVNATLAWSSFLRLRPYFHQIELIDPKLYLQHTREGKLLIAGISVQQQPSDSNQFIDWLLDQKQIIIRNATLIWQDDFRGAPALKLQHAQFRLDRHLTYHIFGLQAQPPQEIASTLDIRGKLVHFDTQESRNTIGSFYIALDQTDLGGWQPWIDYPFPLQGRGGIHAWIDLNGKTAASVTADVTLKNVITNFAPELPPLRLSQLTGRLIAEKTKTQTEISTQALTLTTKDGIGIAPTNFVLQIQHTADNVLSGGLVKANLLDVAMLARFVAHFPLDQNVLERLTAFAPKGHIENMYLSWQGPIHAPTGWKIAAHFNDIGLTARHTLPGLDGLSGNIEGNHQNGHFHFAGNNIHLDLPEVFEESRLTFASLQANGSWSNNKNRIEIALDSANFENPDATGSASGRYWLPENGAGEIDLQAQLTRAEGTSVWRYLPRVVDQDTYQWVRQSIRHATVPDARLRLKGQLDDFPFRDGQGEFFVSVKVQDGLLDYAPGWPVITNLNGEIRFEGPGMRIEAQQARILDVNLGQTVATVPDLDADNNPTITIIGEAYGQTAEFLRFIEKSPVSDYINHFTDNMQAQGNGKLNLQLIMPLASTQNTTVKGEYRFASNQLTLIEHLPPLEQASGLLRFTENQLILSNGQAKFLGNPAKINGKSKAGVMQFQAEGAATFTEVQRYYPFKGLEYVQGTTAWQSMVDISPLGAKIKINSKLDGVSSALPYPFNKTATESWPLIVTINHPPNSDTTIQGQLGDLLKFELTQTSNPQNQPTFHGGISLFQPIKKIENGLLLSAQLNELDLNAWQKIVHGNIDENTSPEPSSAPNPITALSLQADNILVSDQTFSNVHLSASAITKGWQIELSSDQAQGHLNWFDIDGGHLVAHFKRLEVKQKKQATSKSELTSVSKRLPGLDLTAEKFLLNDLDLGSFKLLAHNRNSTWILDAFQLKTPYSTLQGTGLWETAHPQLSHLRIQMDVKNIGKLTKQLGYPDTIKEGKAKLNGELNWSGHPTDIDYGSLSGQFEFNAEKGQFNKLKPGVGRLLGILSLQALPRRITLDFRDVFSDGFVFDRIYGSIAVSQGIMKTQNLEIQGPAARVRMRGTVNLQSETQNLFVTVQPTLSESIAIGAAAGLVNPVAGVVTYLAQKVFSDPIERLFAFDYAITGDWEEPQVEKLGMRSEPIASESPSFVDIQK